MWGIFIWFFFFQGAFACDMILLYMMNTSFYYRQRKFEIITLKYNPLNSHIWMINEYYSKPWLSHLHLHLSPTVCKRKDRTKPKDGKSGHRERRSRKPAAEKEVGNSVKNSEQSEPGEGSSVGQQPTVGENRGPTIPRNTGQRYSALISPQSAEPRQHITFSSHN